MSDFAPSEPRDRFPLWPVYAGLALLGVELAVWGAFLVPVRLPGGIEGLSIVIALVGNVLAGFLAAVGTRRVDAAAVPGIAWLVAALVILTVRSPADELIIPGSLAYDPGIGVVGNAYLFVGTAGALLAVVLAARYIRRANAPTHTW